MTHPTPSVATLRAKVPHSEAIALSHCASRSEELTAPLIVYLDPEWIAALNEEAIRLGVSTCTLASSIMMRHVSTCGDHRG